MYQNGRGVQQLDVEAVRYYRLAVDQKDPPAQSNLNRFY
ncbi:hypothetical protein PNK_1283 [Candidatus Protochlamydia naegleriophila]|uniref:Sel1 repeat family protein n=2 Tax=Candidatus Protochlamydia naegleriophila TaxID=389348 RepID=A0A0U5JDQ1_9BACT|nr:hypothetical protein PNK_1283 [Candidatus Protochlamydia naegleriophila]